MPAGRAAVAILNISNGGVTLDKRPWSVTRISKGEGACKHKSKGIKIEIIPTINCSCT